MNHFQYRSAHILRTLCNKINYTGKIRRVSGQSISNPLLNPLLKYSTIFNFKARKYSTEASEDQKSSADNNNNPFVSDPSIPPTERVLRLVDDIAGLTLNEVTDLTDLLRTKFHIKEMPIMTMMMPGMGMPLMPGVGVGANAGGESKADEKKAAKSFFDLKLESFDAASKIKVIKEVRTFTDLGLKEAKDLVEKAPGLLKKGVGKEEAEQIIAKMKDLGAKVIME